MASFHARKPFVSNKFQFITEVSFQLDSFKKYIEITKSTIVTEIKQKLEEYNKFLRESSDEEIESFHDFTAHEITENTKDLFYNSLFISMYSFLEKKMFQLCRLAEINNEIKIKDLSGKGIYKSYKYLKKVVHIDLKNLNSEWSEITKYNKLRNELVHEPISEIQKNDNNRNLINILKSIDSLTIHEGDDILSFQINDEKLLLNFHKVISNFLHEIYYEKS